MLVFSKTLYIFTALQLFSYSIFSSLLNLKTNKITDIINLKILKILLTYKLKKQKTKINDGKPRICTKYMGVFMKESVNYLHLAKAKCKEYMYL